MKNLFKRIAAVSLTASLFMTGSIMTPVNAEEISPTDATTESAVSGPIEGRGMSGFYDTMYWKDTEGTIDTDFKLRGAFDFTWNDVSSAMCMTGNLFVRKAKDKDLNDIVIREQMHGKPVFDYRAIVDCDGTYKIGAYGWFDKTLTEFFIIDDWGGEDPATYSGNYICTIEADGADYDIYKSYASSFDDPNPITRITSVRKEKRSSENGYVEGTISVYDHFTAWQDYGIDVSDPYELMLCVDAFRSSGTAHVIRSDLYYLVDPDDTGLPIVATGPVYDPEDPYIFPDTLHDTVFTEDASDERDGYYFRLFPNSYPTPEEPTYSLEILSGGNFKCSWENDSKAIFERGLQYYNSKNMTRSDVKQYNGEDITLDYEADINADGSAFAGAYGWLNNLGFEYYIVEGWKDWEVPETAESLGAVGLSDGIYELYKDTTPFYTTVYSVRRENKLSEGTHIEGTIDLNDHFYAWEKYGITPVDPDYVNFAVVSCSGSGSAEVTKNVIKVNGEDIYRANNTEATVIPDPTEAAGSTGNPGTDPGNTAPAYIPGDLNHDQQVDGFDVIFGRRELVKSINGEATIEEADIDCSGDTKVNDLILITKIAMGAEVNVPVIKAAK